MRVVYVGLTLLFLFTVSVFAQRGGTLGPERTPIDIRSTSTSGQPGARPSIELETRNRVGGMPGLSTFQFSAEVLNVHPQENSIEIRRKSNKSEHTFALASDCKIKADQKQFGKKELSLDEIEPGYRVEVLLDLRSNQITQMRVKKPKA
jgi:hypothetical protein